MFVVIATGLAPSLEAAPDRLRLFPKRQSPPSLDARGAWLNSSGPLRLQDLRGKFVVLDFWTYCCINCMHILPELKKLEQAYPNNVVVIGVHSAKFATERDEKNIREAILRHDIEHPVLVDSDLLEWRKWNVNVWPTLAVIDPEGHWIAKHEGEIRFEAFDELLKRALPNFRQKGLLDESPLRFDLERDRQQATSLRFPSKVLADAESNRLFIADSAHHRIVITDLDGKLIDIAGSGARGRQDGGFDQASFDQPRGMALRDGLLYLADTENHSIRELDLANRTVTTIAGIGTQARTAVVRGTQRATAAELSSPWDVLIHENWLYIAMAGTHQIWRMGLPRGRIDLYSGNGVEDIIDGPLSPRVPYQAGFAAYAQPSGLASDGKWLYVADSEGSSIRAVPLDPRGRVQTVLGTANLPQARLFTYGDRDGPVGGALLQHPVGIAHHAGRLFIADTYNHKIKVLDLAGATITTLAGDGRTDRAESAPQFYEPMGLSVAGDRLFVADSNNHRVRIINLREPGQVSTLSIAELGPPVPPPPTGPRVPAADTQLRFEPVEVRPADNAIEVLLQLELPEDHKLNTEAPFGYFLQLAKDEAVFDTSVAEKRLAIERPEPAIRIRLPLTASAGKDRIRITLNYFYCHGEAEAVCKIGTVNWTGQVIVSPEAEATSLTLKHQVQ